MFNSVVAEPEVQVSPKAQPKAQVKKQRVKREVPKETEGSAALERFEANTVLKSRYQHGGQPLEVDPD